MEDFLRKNSLQHLAAVFEAQKITEIDLLKLLTDEEIGNLVDNIGDKIRLKRGITNLQSQNEDFENAPPQKVQILENCVLDQSIKSQAPYDASQNILDQTLPIIFVTDPDEVPPNPIPDFTCLSPSYASTNTVDSDLSVSSENHVVVENIDLEAILNKDYLGQALLSKGKGQGNLNNSERDKLCDIIVSQLLNLFKGKLTLYHFRVISKKLIELMPTEKQGIYFIEPILKKDSARKKSEPARGKLVEKYRNKLHLIRKLDHSNTCNDENLGKKTYNVLDQSVTDSKIWLSKNFEPQAEVLDHWRKSLPLRKISETTTIEEYFNQWPILKTIQAPGLIEYDFEQMHSTVDLNVGQKFDELFECAYNKRKAQLSTTDNIIYSLLEADITSDSKHTIQLFLLPALVPPKTRAKRGKNCWKPSVSESRDSLILHIKCPGDIAEAKKRQVDFAYSKGIPLQPYILIIGACLNNVSTSLVVIDNIEYRCNSVIHAIDFCFKAYQVLDAQYPLASQHLWYLIQWKVYNFHTKKDVNFPHLYELL